MESQQIVVSGWVANDGFLQVDEKVSLPPGPVTVTVEAPRSAGREDTRRALEAIWAARTARRVQPRSRDQIDAEIDAMRNEDEERVSEIERLHAETRGSRN